MLATSMLRRVEYWVFVLHHDSTWQLQTISDKPSGFTTAQLERLRAVLHSINLILGEKIYQNTQECY